jgi:predicted amidohydrolase
MSGEVFVAAQSSSVRGDIEGNVKGHLRLIEKAAKHGAALIVFPELSLTGYEPDLAESHHLEPSDSRLEPFQEMADKHIMKILVGAPYREEENLHIAAFLYQPGEAPLVYTKHHLHDGEEKYFESGTHGLSFDVPGERVSVAICADIAHPEHAENAAANGATLYAAGVLITPGGYDADAALLQGYAENHNMMVVMANFASPSGGFESSGKSAIWDQLGNLMAIGPPQGEALVVVSRDLSGLHGKVISITR